MASDLPGPFQAEFRKTTRIPLFVHPRWWTDAHLQLLRVKGTDSTCSLEHVIGEDIEHSASDCDIAEALEDIRSGQELQYAFYDWATQKIPLDDSEGVDDPREKVDDPMEKVDDPMEKVDDSEGVDDPMEKVVDPREKVDGSEGVDDPTEKVDDPMEGVDDPIQIDPKPFWLTPEWDFFSERVDEDCSQKFCSEWIDKIYRDIRKVEIKWQPWWEKQINPLLSFKFRDTIETVKTSYCLHGFPLERKYEKEFPLSFPIISIMPRNIDLYVMYWNLLSNGKDLRDLRKRRRLRTSKLAEEVAILISMAQKQAEMLELDRFLPEEQDNPKLHLFHPIIISVDKVSLRFIRAHISLNYLKTLADPSRPLIDDLVIEQSEPLNLTVKRNADRAFLSCTSIIDQYLAQYIPLFNKRTVLSAPPVQNKPKRKHKHRKHRKHRHSGKSSERTLTDNGGSSEAKSKRERKSRSRRL